MAGTGSPRSEPRVAGAAVEDRRKALARFLAEASGAGAVDITGLMPLRGGAIQENWAVDARFSGGAFAGEQRLVLRTAAPTGVAASLGRLEEFAVLKAAFSAGVTVPEPLWASDDPEIMGKPFFTMRRVEGTAAAHRITRDPALEPALPAIAERLGRELARIHGIRPPRAEWIGLPKRPPRSQPLEATACRSLATSPGPTASPPLLQPSRTSSGR